MAEPNGSTAYTRRHGTPVSGPVAAVEDRARRGLGTYPALVRWERKRAPHEHRVIAANPVAPAKAETRTMQRAGAARLTFAIIDPAAITSRQIYAGPKAKQCLVPSFAMPIALQLIQATD